MGFWHSIDKLISVELHCFEGIEIKHQRTILYFIEKKKVTVIVRNYYFKNYTYRWCIPITSLINNYNCK